MKFCLSICLAVLAIDAITTSCLGDDLPPNVVIFLVDDMGVMDTSVPFLTDSRGQPVVYPLNEYYRTPNMERLAASGIRFNQFCAMSVCSPTRVSIMTGQNAARHRTTNWINPENDNGGPNGPPDWNWAGLKIGDVTLASVLKQAGYRTIHVGKGHFAPRDFEGSDPSKLGFDVNVGGASFGSPGSYYGEQNYGLGGKRERFAVPHLEKYHGTDTFLSEALTIEANRQVARAVEEKKPFFLYFAHYAVHAPFESDPRFASNYVDSQTPKSAQAFATLVEGMDKSLGDVLDQLQSLGVAENTLVLFLGDNGSDAPLGHQHDVACAAPLRGKKGSHYEGGTRVPLIASWAQRAEANRHQQQLAIASGAIQSQQAAVQDLFPTVLAACGVAAPQGHAVDGRPLQVLLSGKPDPERPEEFLMHYPHSPHRSEYFTSYREGDWKVIYHYFPSPVSGGSHYQLFHLASDPFEQTDLASERPEELHRMMDQMIVSLAAHDAVFPIKPGSAGPLRPTLP